MPQFERAVSSFDLVADLNNYYHNSVLGMVDPKTNETKPVMVREVAWHYPEGSGPAFPMAFVRTIRSDGEEWSSRTLPVPFSELILTLPPMSMVQSGGHWFHLCRQPARRMRKGFHQETISMVGLEDDTWASDHGVTHPHIVKQAWFGNEERVTNNVVVWRQGIYYTTEKVATIGDEGGIILTPHKEKLGEFVCKLLQSNWENVTSKHSGLTLPSSVPML